MIFGLIFLGHLFVTATAITSYKIWCQGNCDRDVVPDSTASGVVLMGGGVRLYSISAIYSHN